MHTEMETLEKRLPALPDSEDVLAVARRVNWYKEPLDAIANTADFLAHLMTYGRPEDIETIRRYLGVDDFRRALEQAPPGIMDARSWNYWNLIVGRIPAPPMPKRKLS